MTKEHLFLIDPLESLHPTLDSSLRVMYELSRDGDRVYVAEPRELGWKSAHTAHARARELRFRDGPAAFTAGAPALRGLDTFASIHMRKDPPYDLDYIGTTWLLDAAGPATRVYNAPEALRRYNEKLAILGFPDDIAPTLVSTDPDALLAFIEGEAQGDAVLKPLTLFGGRGIERIKLEGSTSAAAARDLLSRLTCQGSQMRLVQAFDPAIFDGEVRAFTAFGEPIAWCLKRPAAGNFLANTRAGAQLEAYVPAPAVLERVRRVAAALGRDGVAFIGFDLIGGRLSEINLTSPRLLQAPGDQSAPYRRVAQLIHQDLAKSPGVTSS